MSKIKFNLKSVCSITIKDANGKTYRLKQGTNTLELDTDDYLALTKSLGLKPTLLRNKQHTPKQVAKPAVKTNDTQDQQPKQELQVDNAPSLESDKVEDAVESVSESTAEPTDEAKEQEPSESVDEAKELIADTTNSSDNTHTDYSTWSYNELKAEYKNITGNNCRLKKGEIIAFLQEHENV
jgi:hypothetical protein